MMSVLIAAAQSVLYMAMEAGAGIEPAMRDLQSRALPLCYPAVPPDGTDMGGEI